MSCGFLIKLLTLKVCIKAIYYLFASPAMAQANVILNRLAENKPTENHPKAICHIITYLSRTVILSSGVWSPVRTDSACPSPFNSFANQLAVLRVWQNIMAWPIVIVP